MEKHFVITMMRHTSKTLLCFACSYAKYQRRYRNPKDFKTVSSLYVGRLGLHSSSDITTQTLACETARPLNRPLQCGIHVTCLQPLLSDPLRPLR